ncbi:tetratricopeptide repeat protein, partial [Caenispirillum salinarum]|uniref:tetratricopeptide repeat protein n=1 Tax=Caenispirillum salinarum TaxID=859058 RepID=UPI0005BC4919
PSAAAADDTAAAAPPRPDRLDAEAGLRAQRSADASAAAGAPITIDTGSGAASAPAPAPRVANVSVSSVPTETRDTLAGGYGALMRGNYAGALNAYDSVLDREPDNVSALMGRAAALHKLGMAAEARDAYERVLARQPDNREALTNMIALIGDADPATAIAELERLQSVAPDFSPIPAQLGMLLARQGRVGEAMGALRRAIVLSPENALYHYNMAVVADRAGRAGDAARSYDRVLRLIDGGGAPAGLRAQAIRDRLRYLRARL